MEVRAQALETRLKSLRVEYDALVRERAEERPQVAALEAQVASLLEQQRQSAEENETLKEHVRDQTNDVTLLQNQLRDARAELARVQGNAGSVEFKLRHEVSRLTLLEEKLQARLVAFEKEAGEYRETMRSLRSNADKEINELSTALHGATSEADRLREHNTMLETEMTLAREKAEHYCAELQNLEKAAESNKMAFATELAAQKRVIDAHKRSDERAQAQLEAVNTELAGLQTQAAAQAEAFQEMRIAAEMRTSASQDAADARVAQLEQELKDARSTVTTIADSTGHVDPTAAVAAATPATVADSSVGAVSPLPIPLAFRNLTVTGMYDRVVEAERRCHVAESATTEARLELEQAKKDLSARTPAVEKLQQDYTAVVQRSESIVTR